MGIKETAGTTHQPGRYFTSIFEARHATSQGQQTGFSNRPAKPAFTTPVKVTAPVATPAILPAAKLQKAPEIEKKELNVIDALRAEKPQPTVIKPAAKVTTKK